MTTFDPKYYAKTADEHGWGVHSAVLDFQRSKFVEREVRGKKILDVGCATGVYVDFLAKKGLDAWGVDFTPEFIKAAKKNHKGNFQVANAYELPFEDKSFDTVMLFDILEHVDDEKALKEAARVAKERIIVIVPRVNPDELNRSGIIFNAYRDYSHLRYYDEESLGALISRSGLKQAKFEDLAPINLMWATQTSIKRWPTAAKLLNKAYFGFLKVVFNLKLFHNSEIAAVIDLK